jgi:type IV pilus assembly protein PilW
MKAATQTSTDIRWWSPEVKVLDVSRGYTLMEVMIGMFLTTLLISGIVQLLSGSVSTYRLQLNQGQLEESARYARDILVSHISQAGFQPEPWQEGPALAAITSESLDAGQLPGDQLGLQRWSKRNCYGNENSVTDDDGQPEYYLLQARFQVNGNNNLAMTCRFGPDVAGLQTQINNFGLVENVDSMQVLYAEDRDDDRVADTWVTAQAWQQESNIRSVKIALLLSTQQPFKQHASEQITLLDQSISSPADGRLRRVSLITSAIRGRLN